MSGFITMGQALALIGMAPVKHGNSVITENLRVAKSTFPRPGMGGMLENLIKNGPGSMLQNPMSAISGLMGGNLAGALPQIQAMIPPLPKGVTTPWTAATDPSGMTGLLQAVGGSGGFGGLTGALSGLTGAANSLAGISPPTTAFPYSSIDVMNLSGFGQLGLNMPAGLDMTHFLAPLMSAPTIATVNDQVVQALQGAGVSGGVLSNGNTTTTYGGGTGGVAGATAAIQAAVATLSGISAQSANAFGTAQDLLVSMASIVAIAGQMVTDNGDPGDLAGYYSLVLQPSASAQIDDILNKVALQKAAAVLPDV